MKQNARIVTYGIWGINRPAYSFALTGARLMKHAGKYGRAAGVTRYRDDGKEGESSEAGSLPIGLSRTTVFSASDNAKTAWTNLVGGTDYLDELPNPFAGSVPGLGHTSDEPAAYSGVLVPESTGHVIRLYLYKAPESVTYPVTVLDWGGWQFQIADNGATLQRLAPSWTSGGETALIALLSIEEPTSAQQEEIAALESSLYADSASIRLDSDKSNSFGSFYEIEFVPEIGGKVSVYCNGQFAGDADHTDILRSRKAGVLWPESPLVIRRNGGHFFWQTGYASHATTGEIRWPYQINEEVGSGDFSFTMIRSEPPGTDITLSRDGGTQEIVATFTTGNRRVTPMLYLAQAYVDAGERNGSDEVSWDSDAGVSMAGKDPILEIEPSCEGELRRGQYNVQIKDVSGKTFELVGSHYDTLENRVVDLYIGNPPMSVVKNGIVRQSTITDFGSVKSNQLRRNVARPDTCAQLEICDAWSLLEEHELEGGELIGDALRVGVLLRRALRRIGTPASELSGIPTSGSAAGRVLPSAAIGEGWAVVNSAGSLADFIYYIIERYGMGRILWRGRDGIWYFTPRPTAVRVIGGHEVHFKSDASGHNHPDTYPGRYAMLRPIDLPRDASQFYNKYRVVGADGYGDEPLSREWTIHESIERGFGAGSKKFIGREKRMHTIEDSSLRTADDVEWALRSAVEMHGMPPRYLAFETYFHAGLFIGDRVKADGENYIIRRISGGSWANDTMNLLLQEVGY